MLSIARSRRSQLVLASLFVLCAATWQSNQPALKAVDVSSIQEAIALVDAGALVIDVRESPKTHLPGALLIPIEVLTARLASMEVAKTQSIVVYCGNGSSLGPRAAQALAQAGFTHVVNLEAGLEGWRAAGMPVLSS